MQLSFPLNALTHINCPHSAKSSNLEVKSPLYHLPILSPKSARLSVALASLIREKPGQLFLLPLRATPPSALSTPIYCAGISTQRKSQLEIR